MNEIKNLELELRGIDGYFTLTNYYEHIDHYNDYDDEMEEEITFDEKSIVMLLEHNKSVKNNMNTYCYFPIGMSAAVTATLLSCRLLLDGTIQFDG